MSDSCQLTSGSNLNSAIVTISVGPEQRLFAAHEDVLRKSPYFADACRAQFFEANGKRVELPNEVPEVFSAILEFLYKGDYSPKLNYDKTKGSWFLDGGKTGKSMSENVIYTSTGNAILKDTIIYVRIPSIHLSYCISIDLSQVLSLPLSSA